MKMLDLEHPVAILNNCFIKSKWANFYETS